MEDNYYFRNLRVVKLKPMKHLSLLFFIFKLSIVFAQNNSEDMFYGVNLNQKVSVFGCATIDVFTDKPHVLCTVKDEELDKLDSEIKKHFDLFVVKYRANEPDQAISLICGSTVNELNSEELNSEFESVIKLIRKKYGNPTEMMENNIDQAAALWSLGKYSIIVMMYTPEKEIKLVFTSEI